MKTSYKIALVAVPAAIISFVLSRVIWPDIVGMAAPSATQLPFFMFLSALESVSFGAGLGFLIFGWPMLKGANKLTVAAFISALWFLVSWWPHDNMHRVNPEGNYAGLLRIEFLFHFTLMVGGFIIASYLWRTLRRGTSSPANIS